MASGSRTKAYGLVAVVMLALGLWWWLGRDPGSAGESEGEGKGSDAAGASASADALRPDVTGVESYRYDKLVRVSPGTTVKLGVRKGDVLRAVEVTAGPPV